MKKTYTFTLFLAIVFLVFFVLTELGLRIAHYARERARHLQNEINTEQKHPSYDEAGINPDTFDKMAQMQYSTYLGYMPKENSDGKGYRTNNVFFRYAVDMDFKKKDNEYRVFVTGGSAAWGTGVKQDKNLSSVAESLARNDFPEKVIRIISAGVGGYCSTQERIFIENWILGFSPDMVILFSGWNDTYYGFSGENILLEQDFLGYRARAEGGEPGSPSSVRQEKPVFKNYFLKTHYYIDKALYKTRHEKKEVILAKILKRERPIESVIETLLWNLHILSSLSQRYGFRLVFVLQPSLFVTQKQLTPYERGLLDTYTNKYIGFDSYNLAAYSKIKAALATDSKVNNYEFYDGDDFISSVKDSLFIDYVHFGDRGYRILWQRIYDTIIKNNIR